MQAGTILYCKRNFYDPNLIMRSDRENIPLFKRGNKYEIFFDGGLYYSIIYIDDKIYNFSKMNPDNFMEHCIGDYFITLAELRELKMKTIIDGE